MKEIGRVEIRRLWRRSSIQDFRALGCSFESDDPAQEVGAQDCHWPVRCGNGGPIYVRTAVEHRADFI